MTINFGDFCDAFFKSGRKDQFSYNGKKALFEYIESLEQDTGDEMELDVIGLCCDFTEFDTGLDAAKDCSDFTIDEDLNEEEQEREAVQFLTDSTTIIQFDGGVIIQNF